MRSVSPQLQQELTQLFGSRVAFDGLECLFYSHDVGSLPSLVGRGSRQGRTYPSPGRTRSLGGSRRCAGPRVASRNFSAECSGRGLGKARREDIHGQRHQQFEQTHE